MTVSVICGDSRDVLKTLGDETVDSIVCDPPYALVSIGKRFGADAAAPAKSGKSGVYARASAGFMGQKWDTGETAFAVEFWAEVYRVLKPGGHVVAFAGTRTYHRLACAVEDAGFEIRDMISWLYGSGFPKSHDVAKGIDKAAGVEREVQSRKAAKVGFDPDRQGGGGWSSGAIEITAPATPEAATWQGWGTALKPACEPIVLARKPLIGTVVENVLEHGTGAINVDGCRVETDEDRRRPSSGGDNGLNGTGTFKIRERRIDDQEKTSGRWPANVVHDGSDEVVAAFPDSPGQQYAVTAEHAPKVGTTTFGDYGPRKYTPPRLDSGSAARFFYTAKADATERLGSKHPTVKPVDLMRWLCRLVTPPGGLIVDPFAGSGTTGVAAIAEGFDAILIEREPGFADDSRRRIAWALGQAPHTSELVRKQAARAKMDDDLF